MKHSVKLSGSGSVTGQYCQFATETGSLVCALL